MDSTTTLILVAIVAWIGQIAFGFFQIRSFNRMVQSMSQKGHVKIGRTKSRWKARTLIVVAENDQQTIVDAKVLNGISVFARPKTLDKIVGLSYPLSAAVMNELAKGTQEAISVAYEG